MMLNLGMSDSEATETVEELMRIAKENIIKKGEDSLPKNFAELILSGDTRFKKDLKKIKKEGVRDEDIRWWWNLDPLEREMMRMSDFYNKLTLYTSLLREGKSIEETFPIISKYHPRFEQEKGTQFGSDEDAPLPEELKDRINIYIQKRFMNDNEQYKKELEESSSFNALIRKEIREGKL